MIATILERRKGSELAYLSHRNPRRSRAAAVRPAAPPPRIDARARNGVPEPARNA
ncbi:hypothetical protein ACWGJT_14860 [Streptomyces xantholiticus]